MCTLVETIGITTKPLIHRHGVDICAAHPARPTATVDLPLKLDGEEHTIRAQLTRIANVAPDAGFQLQLVAQSNLFDAQRAAGLVTISDLDARLPITQPRR